MKPAFCFATRTDTNETKSAGRLRAGRPTGPLLMRLSTSSDDARTPRRPAARRRADVRTSIRSAFGFITAFGAERPRGAHTASLPIITNGSVAAPAPKAGRRRHHVTLAVAGVSFGLIASLTTALPSYAAHAETVQHKAAAAVASTADQPGRATKQKAALQNAILAAAEKGDVQKLSVSAAVATSAVEKDTFATVDVTANLEKRYGISASYAQQLIGTSNPNGRAAIIATALTYLGDPYVLGGASHSGIDCSGLTMVAYAAAGVSLVHYVPNQDAVGTPISAAAARPGDLVVFDDEDHVGIYMGNGMVLHAPTEGRDVELDPLTEWSGIAYHYTRLI